MFKKLKLAGSSALIVTILFLSGSVQAQGVTLKSAQDSLAYGIGLSIAGSLKMQGLSKINTDLLQAAIKDVLNDKQPLMSEEQANQFLMAYFTKMEDSLRRTELAKAEPNRIAGENFLAENKKRPGVVTTESGLQYEILKAGDGTKPTAADRVKVHYHGTLTDGSVFDSSVERGEPIELPVSGVIAGWTEALQLMPVGSKWKIYLPYQLAYGERQAGPKIAPMSALIFEVELLEILK